MKISSHRAAHVTPTSSRVTIAPPVSTSHAVDVAVNVAAPPSAPPRSPTLQSSPVMPTPPRMLTRAASTMSAQPLPITATSEARISAMLTCAEVLRGLHAELASRRVAGVQA